MNAFILSFAAIWISVPDAPVFEGLAVDPPMVNGVAGAVDVAYTLLLQHKHPSWLYSVDQGATTVWERWNSYTKKDGFGPVGMNSFNHYAYGAVLGLGWVKAEYQSAAGLIKSAWRYEGEKWIWEFTIPEGATATVIIPNEKASALYSAGTYTVSAFGK